MYRILAVDNEEKMCKLIKASLEMEGYSVDMAFSGQAAIEKIKSDEFSIIITDLKMERIGGLQVLEFVRKHMPSTEVIIITAFATQDTALTAMKEGAFDYLIKPFKMDELNIRVSRIIRQKELEAENNLLKGKDHPPSELPGIIGKSQKMRQVFQQIKKVCNSETSVIIRGESGTGKDLVAKAIHESSKRTNRPFVAINCAALPENLLESELFGFEKGAFTGAVQSKKGLFETADKGTVFLDEIGDMPPGLQAKLLRVLQSNELTHLGGNTRIKVDFRLITATHQNLEKLIEQNLFRSDLYYRINVFPIYLPPLRERKEDIPELIQYFLNNFPEKSLSQQVKRKLIEYNYPGNIRELENIITRTALLSDSVIEDVDLPVEGQETENQTVSYSDIPDEGINLDNLEQILIRKAIEKSGGNKSTAAQLLGITRRRLYSMMQRFGIEE
jgi:two-component system response regulator PilR (NtrC family)